MKHSNQPAVIPCSPEGMDNMLKILACGHQGMFLSIPPDLSQFKDCHPIFTKLF